MLPVSDDGGSTAEIVRVLEEAGASIRAFDPEAIGQARPIMPKVAFCEEPYGCLEGADALVIVTEWDAFRALDLPRIKGALKSPVVVDLRNIYRPEEMRKLGFAYTSVGRV